MEAKAITQIPIRLDILDSSGEPILTSEFVKEKIVLGRILSADLRIDDPRVSRIHALLETKGDKIMLTDLASSHGTFVNGEKIVERAVKAGDIIRLGHVEVRIEKGSGKVTAAQTRFEGTPVGDGEETMIDIDRSLINNQMDRRGEPAKGDRRKKDAFPDEQRLDDRRDGDRRIDQRTGERRAKGADGATPTKGHSASGAGSQGTSTDMETEKESERRAAKDRRTPREDERRLGDRRRNDRRVFDITSLERRIEDRRLRKGDDDMLPEEMEKAFEQPEHSRELEVTVLWGDHILDVSNYHEAAVLTVGESPRCDYIIPSEGIPDEFPIVSIEEDGNAHLAFTADMKGTIRARDKIYTLAQLKDEKFVRRDADYFVLPLKQDDFAKISIGTINFFVLYVKPAPRIKAAPLMDRDPLLIRTMIGSIIVLAILFLSVGFLPKPIPVQVDMIPERFAKIVIKKRPNISKMGIQAKGMEDKQGGSVAGEGGPAKGDEGEAGRKDLSKQAEKPQTLMPKSKPKEASDAPKVAAKTPPQKLIRPDKAKSVGLLKAFSQTGAGKDIKNLLDAGEGPEGRGGFDDFGKAVKGHRGKSIEEVGGAGGLGLKGVGEGGGGKTIGIDGPSTKGLGRGYVGDGIGEGVGGPGRLGLKGEHAISIVSENVQVLSGLPKDVINAVVQRHRGEIRACYDAALQRNPNLRGKIVAAFTIQPNGIVSYAGTKESSLGDSALENCVISRIRTWVFPKPEAPVVTEVSAYPFFLNPAN